MVGAQVGLTWLKMEGLTSHRVLTGKQSWVVTCTGRREYPILVQIPGVTHGGIWSLPLSLSFLKWSCSDVCSQGPGKLPAWCLAQCLVHAQ